MHGLGDVAFALRRDMMAEAGGFGAGFASPAHAAFDLCMRLRAGGRQVLYQPLARRRLVGRRRGRPGAGPRPGPAGRGFAAPAPALGGSTRRPPRRPASSVSPAMPWSSTPPCRGPTTTPARWRRSNRCCCCAASATGLRSPRPAATRTCRRKRRRCAATASRWWGRRAYDSITVLSGGARRRRSTLCMSTATPMPRCSSTGSAPARRRPSCCSRRPTCTICARPARPS